MKKVLKESSKVVMILVLVMSMSLPVMAAEDMPDSWANDEIEEAYSNNFVPEAMKQNYKASITRKEFCILAVQMVEKKAGIPILDYLKLRGLSLADEDTFEDVSDENVLIAKALGITDGTGPKTFSPDRPLKREEAAKFLAKTALAVGEDIKSNVPEYADLDEISDWAKPYIGYMYDINVMRGVGENAFNPGGAYQRQQAFVTFQRLWDEIDEVSYEKLNEATPTTLEEIKATLTYGSGSSSIDTTIKYEGRMYSENMDVKLNYDLYRKGADVHVTTYFDDRQVAAEIYNYTGNVTYTEEMLYTHYGHLDEGNLMEQKMLNVDYINWLEAEATIYDVRAEYVMSNEENLLHFTWNVLEEDVDEDQVTTEDYWFSLKYLLPVKYHKITRNSEGDFTVDWSKTGLSEGEITDLSLFDIPSDVEVLEATNSTRDLLLYKVDSIVSDEPGQNDLPTQVAYYSKESYQELVRYFKDLLKDTADYEVFLNDNRTSIDGTIDGNMVIVIVNDYMTSKPDIDKNYVNVNYY